MKYMVSLGGCSYLVKREKGFTFVELEQLEGAPGPPTLFFGEPVVGVALVLG